MSSNLKIYRHHALRIIFHPVIRPLRELRLLRVSSKKTSVTADLRLVFSYLEAPCARFDSSLFRKTRVPNLAAHSIYVNHWPGVITLSRRESSADLSGSRRRL